MPSNVARGQGFNIPEELMGGSILANITYSWVLKHPVVLPLSSFFHSS